MGSPSLWRLIQLAIANDGSPLVSGDANGLIYRGRHAAGTHLLHSTAACPACTGDSGFAECSQITHDMYIFTVEFTVFVMRDNPNCAQASCIDEDWNYQRLDDRY
jgi:hypothetical protein